MKFSGSITVLSLLIILLAGSAAYTGIFSTGGPGSYTIESVRGETVTVYGKGLYKHMSKDVAPQGIAQDYVTLFIAIPILFIALLWAKRGSLRGRYLLAGTLGYFLVTYLFYLVMGMYNALFLVYSALLGLSFFAFALVFRSLVQASPKQYFDGSTPVKSTGGFLIFNTLAIALLWLGVIVPPLLDGTIIPEQVEHYTTLIVQGLDLGLLLPLSFVSGLLFIQQKPMGYLLAPIYFGFLSLLMTALTAKVLAMAQLGQEVMPAIIIIPLFNITAIVCTILILKHIQSTGYENS